MLTVRSIFVVPVREINSPIDTVCLPISQVRSSNPRTQCRARLSIAIPNWLLPWHERDSLFTMGMRSLLQTTLYVTSRFTVTACRFSKPGGGQSVPFVGASRGEFYTALLAASKISGRAPRTPMVTHVHNHQKLELRDPADFTLWTSEGQWSSLAACSSSETRFAAEIRRQKSFVATEFSNPRLISSRLKWLCRQDPKFSVMVGVAEPVTVARRWSCTAEKETDIESFNPTVPLNSNCVSGIISVFHEDLMDAPRG